MDECVGGRGARSQFRLSATGGFLQGLYPLRGDIMDVGQDPQATGLSANDFVSPNKGTRTRTVREYEQTINELKKENFDLKLRVYLFEEAMNKNRGKDCPFSEEGKTVEVMVQLQLETESLRNELSYKDKLLHETMEQNEKFSANVKELEEKIAQLQTELSELPSKDNYILLLKEREDLLKVNETLERDLNEKHLLLDETNQKIDILSNRNSFLEEKLQKRRMAIQGLVYKSYQEKEMLPDEFRNLMISAVEVAKTQDKEALDVALKNIHIALNRIMPLSVPELDSKKKRNSHGQSSKELKESSSFILPSENAMNMDVNRIEHLNELPMKNLQLNSESSVHFSTEKEKSIFENYVNYSENGIVDLMNFSSASLPVIEERNIPTTSVSPKHQDSVSYSGAVNANNILLPKVYRVSSYQNKDASLSNSLQNENTSTSVILHETNDLHTSVSLPEMDTSSPVSLQYKSIPSSIFYKKDVSISASLQQCKNKYTYTSSDKNMGTSVSLYDNKNASTSISSQHCKNVSIHMLSDKKDAFTSVSLQQSNKNVSTSVLPYKIKDASTSISLYDNKDASTCVSFYENKCTSTSDLFIENKNVSTSILLCKNKDESTSVSLYDNKDASIFVSFYENKSTSTSDLFIENKNVSTSVSLYKKDASTSILLSDNKDASTSISLSDNKDASTYVSLYESKNTSTSDLYLESKNVSTSVSLYENKDASTSVLLYDNKDASTFVSFYEDKSTSTSDLFIENKNVSTSVSLHDNKDASTSVSLYDNKDASTSVALYDNKDVSTSVSLYDNKDVSTHVSFYEDKSSTTSDLFIENKGVSTSVSLYKNKDASTCVPLYESKGTSISLQQSKNISTSDLFIKNKNASTSVSLHENKDASTSVSLYDNKDVSTCVSGLLFENKDVYTSISHFSNKDSSTSTFLQQSKNTSTSELLPEKENISTSISLCDNKDASICVSLYESKGISTTISPQQFKNTSTSELLLQNKDTNTSNLQFENKDSSTSTSLQQSINTSTSELLPEEENISTSVSLCKNQDVSTFVSLCENKDVSTSVSLQQLKNIYISDLLPENRDISISNNEYNLLSQIRKLSLENENLRQKLQINHLAIENLRTSKTTKSQRVQTEEIKVSSSEVPLCTNTCTQTNNSIDSINEVTKQQNKRLPETIDGSKKENQTILNEVSLLETVARSTETSQTILNEDYMNERNELHERLAFSYSINVELMKHLHNLERFLEDLLQHKLDSSIENSNEQPSYIDCISKCLNESLKLSNVLSDHLSICEGSKLFEECKSMLHKSDSLLDEKSLPQLDFSDLNGSILPLVSGQRHFLHTASVMAKHPSYPSSDSDVWSEPDRNISLQRIGIPMQYSPISAKSPRKLKSKERKVPSRLLTGHNTSSSDLQLWSKHSRRNGSTCRSLYATANKKRENFILEKYYFILTEKVSNLKSLLNKLEKSTNEGISVETWNKTNSLMIALNEAIQKFQLAKELDENISSPICVKCILFELLISLNISSEDNNIEDVPFNCKSKYFYKFWSEINELRDSCLQLFPDFSLLFSLQWNKLSKSTQSDPLIYSKEEKIAELEYINIDMTRKNEVLTNKFDKLQSVLGQERNMLESTKAENQFMSNEISNLKDKIIDLNYRNKTLLKEYNEIQNLLGQERHLLESIKTENVSLLKEINGLKEENLILQKSEKALSFQNSELNKKVTNLGESNSELNGILKVLEKKNNESDIVLEQLSSELQKNKLQLENMSIKYLKLEGDLSQHTKLKEEFAEKLKIMEISSFTEKEKYVNEISNLNAEKKSCLDKLEHIQNKVHSLEKENSYLNSNLNSKKEELNSSLQTIKLLENDKDVLCATCTQLQSDLEHVKQQYISLEKKFNCYETEVSKKEAEFSQKLQQLERQLSLEKMELVNKISQISSERNNIQQELKFAKEYSEKLMIEKTEMDKRLAESCKKVASLKLSNNEKEDGISQLNVEKNEALEKLNCEKKYTQKLVDENNGLNQKLVEYYQQITSLELLNKKHEETQSSLMKKIDQIQALLLSSNSSCTLLGNDLKDMRETVLNLESKCASYAKELVESTGLKNYVIEYLLSVGNEIITSRHKMAEICKAYQCESFVECDETVVVDYNSIIDEDNIIKLCDIVSVEFKRLLKFVDMLYTSKLYSEKVHSIGKKYCDKTTVTDKQREMQGNEIEHLKAENNNLQKLIEENQKLLSDHQNSRKFNVLEIQTLNEKLQLSENEVKRQKLLQKLKEDEIMILQERVFNLQTYVNNMLEEKNDYKKKMDNDHIEKSVQVDHFLPNNLLFSQSKPVSAVEEACQVDYEEFDNITDDPATLSTFKNSCCYKYQRKCESLEKKLVFLQKGVEILEDEKKNLREFQTSHLNPLKVKDSYLVKLADLESKLEQKKAFIIELKAELMKVCNSLIDKERELDNAKMKLSKYETNSNFKYHYSMIETKTVDANLTNLKKYKWKLIQTIFDIQKAFYEKKGIHLNYFNKFKDHVNILYSQQLMHPLSKSVSLPMLGSHSGSQFHKNLKSSHLMSLELDIEYLENLKIFLSRFFVPSVQQYTQVEYMPKVQDSLSSATQTDPTSKLSFLSKAVPSKIISKLSDTTSHKIPDYLKSMTDCPKAKREIFPEKLEAESEFQSVDILKLDKAEFFELLNSTSVLPLECKDILQKYPSFENFALNVSHCLDFMEKILKSLKNTTKFCDLDNFDVDSEDKIEAKSLLLKILKETKAMYKKSEVLFNLNAILKSLDFLFPQISKTSDMSDRESVLSEETIGISRSVTPMSGEDIKPIKLTKSIQSTSDTGILTKPKAATLSSSFESIHRSQYSSPDLGIESDPNHESSVLDQKEIENISKYQKFEEKENERKMSFINSKGTGMWKGPLCHRDDLYAVGHLPHYELLKREIQESLVGIKSVLCRTGDGLRHIANYTSPRKTLEYSTMRSIKDSCGNVEVCLKEAYNLIEKFWVAPCPSEEEWNCLVKENQNFADELSKLRVLMQNQECEFKKAIGKLEHAELLKATMEKKISKKLVRTKKVIRQAELKLLERGCQDFPPVPKYQET